MADVGLNRKSPLGASGRIPSGIGSKRERDGSGHGIPETALREGLQQRQESASGVLRPEVTKALCDFLEVAVNHLLYLRSIYPPEIFQRSRFASVPVYCSRHPGLRCYIRDAINDLSPYIDKGVVERIDLAVFSVDGRKLYERIVFDFSIFSHAPATASSASHHQDSLESIEYGLRSFLVKASVSECLQRPLPQDCAWELVAHSKNLPSGRSSSGQFWIPADCAGADLPDRPNSGAAAAAAAAAGAGGSLAAPAEVNYDSAGVASSIHASATRTADGGGYHGAGGLTGNNPHAAGAFQPLGSERLHGYSSRSSVKVPRLFPIKSMKTGALSLQLYVERS